MTGSGSRAWDFAPPVNYIIIGTTCASILMRGMGMDVIATFLNPAILFINTDAVSVVLIIVTSFLGMSGVAGGLIVSSPPSLGRAFRASFHRPTTLSKVNEGPRDVVQVGAPLVRGHQVPD